MQSSQPLAGTRTPRQIADELARDFNEAFRQIHGTTPRQRDPVLTALFQAFASQISRLYDEAADAFPIGVLEDLTNGLALPPRAAIPSQTVVAFDEIEEREAISPETALYAYAPNDERFIFAPDATIQVAPARIAFAAVYEAGRLHTIEGARLPGEGPEVPGSGRAMLQLRAAPPTLFLAIEVDAEHLSGLGLYIETQPGSPIAAALGRSVWHLLDDRGHSTEAGFLRVQRGRAGIGRLGWLDTRPGDGVDTPLERSLPLPSGIYGGNVWIFPDVPPERRYLSRIPAAIAAAVPTLLPNGHEDALNRPLAWIQVPLPMAAREVKPSIHRVQLNCITASNVEIINETVSFDRTGRSVQLQPEGRGDRHLLGVLSVTGESGSRYSEAAAVELPVDDGRYRYRNGRLELQPARTRSGKSDHFAVVRLLYCDGARANDIEIDGVSQIVGSLTRNAAAAVSNLTPAQGGLAPPDYAAARIRFADVLRTRERVVTAADVEIAVKAFEPRARSVRIETVPEPGPGGLRQAERVTVAVVRRDFADPAADLLHLREELESHLQRRATIGSRFLVEVVGDE